MFQSSWKLLARTIPRRSRFPRNDGWITAAAVLGASGATALSLDDDSLRSGHSRMRCQAQAAMMHHHDEQESPSVNAMPPPKANNEEKTAGGGSSFRLKDMYQIEQVLGEGAYGMVYKAMRKADGAVVALKTMPRSLTGKTDFEREVAALQLLSKPPGHENIVQLYDLHRDEKNYYLSMEYVDGGELLEHLIESGPYSEGLAAQFLRQFAEAICHVHSNGLAHADLKPENLLLSSNDTKQAKLKVADFGCATSHDLSRKDSTSLPVHEFAKGCSFLHMVALGNQFELEKMLMERPSLVNFRDYDFRTPLHLAASEGHVDICKYLVEKGARVNRSDRWGGSPLDDAYRHRHSEVIQYLRSQGATFGTKTQSPRFIQAASEGDQEEVKALLEFGNIDVDEGDYDRRAALHLAAGEGRTEIVDLLCKAGADVNIEDRWKNRPLDDAKNAKKNSKAIMTILAKYGAKSVKEPSLGRHISVDNAESKALTSEPTKKKGKGEKPSGTIAYWSPELFTNAATATPAADMWATGVIMFILLTGSHPFDKYGDLTDEAIEQVIINVCCDKNNYEKLMNERVFDDRIEGLSDSCVELMRQLLHPDPRKRKTSKQFLRHPWIQGLTASWTTMGKTHGELKSFWQNKFRAEVKKKFAASLSISGEQLSENDLVEMFRAMDLKKNGVLELDEIQTIFRELGISDKTTNTIFASVDLDGTGVIHFDEFRALLTSNNTTDGPGIHVDYLQQRFKSHILDKFVGTEKEASCDNSRLREIFNAIDLEGNGVLDPHDLRVVLRSAGEQEDVITRIVASLDINHDGKVSWDEFLLIMGTKDQ